ncbi:AtpZ/AtpI family protein [Leptospira sp. GIMC2001]|uniref:AtpZ/AtpI family protein n=1 Tax=Leptospira sp. GIMC2001 TaxID=1513297 RepID=UPI00234A5468|nr:AtpZ/AtpI family protein [Leptospira sp. GIMC2001]WCL48932.1 AtpZ/AtpI family protein [Leptospira sp. GIMC2001]
MGQDRKTPKIKSAWHLAGLGTEFTGIILFFLLGGSWLDKQLGSAPWILLLGMILGFSLGLFHIVRRTRQD